MKNFYNEKYRSLKISSEEACRCVKANPCANLSSELGQVLSSVKSLDRGLIGGTVQSDYSNSIDSISSELNIIIKCIDSIFKKAEELYVSLDEHLDLLEKFNNEYARKASERYTKLQTKTFTFGEDSKKRAFEAEKQRMLNKIEKVCLEEQGTIDTVISDLQSIDGMSLSSESIALANKIGVNRLDKVSDYASYLNQRIYEDLFQELTSKVDIKKMGYDKETVMQEFYKYNILELDDMISKIVDRCPSNFNETLAGMQEFTGDLHAYGYPKNNKLRDKRYFSISTVNIGGHDFEIMEVISLDKMNFLGILDRHVDRALVINNIASYPKTFLDGIAHKSKDGSIPSIILDVDMKDVYPKKNYRGMYQYNDKNSIHIEPFDTEMYVLNHELGHRFNDYYVDSKSGGPYVTGKYQEELEKLFKEEYLKVSVLPGTFKKYHQSLLLEDNKSEMFSECMDAYMRYGEELKIVAPGIYNFYHNLLGDKTTSQIVIGGRTIAKDSDVTGNLIWGHL